MVRPLIPEYVGLNASALLPGAVNQQKLQLFYAQYVSGKLRLERRLTTWN
jgi:hypothetical protein